MDQQAIFELIDGALFNMENSTCDELMDLLNYVEHVAIEDKKTELFQKRINFICLANCFEATMERDYNCKQIKTFLKRNGYSETAASQTANKLNEARRVYPRLENVVANCCSCPYVDIRDLTIHEMYLANSLSWVMKRNAEAKPKNSIPDNAPVEYDAGSVELTKDHILNSDWYKAACHNPTLIATILSGITTRVINDSLYRSER